MLLTWLMMFLIAQTDDTYILWLKSNKRMELKEPPKCESARCLITLKSGQVVTLPANLVDLERSEKFNEELALKRKQAKEEEERIYREVQEAEKLEQERIKQRSLAVTSDTLITKYKRPENQSALTETPEEPQTSNQATTKTFQSSDPVYVASETVMPTDSGYTLTNVVRIGAVDVIGFTLELKVDLAGAEPFTAVQELKGPWPVNTDVTVTFQVTNKAQITRTSYNLVAQQKESRSISGLQ